MLFEKKRGGEMKRKVEAKEVKITDLDREEIAKQVEEGCTSGIMSDGEGNRISWILKIDKWEE